METSIFLAKVIGLYSLIMGIFVLLRFRSFTENIAAFTKNPGFILLAGIITLILGILLITSHNIWVANWQVVITIVAWIVFLSGLFRIFFFNKAEPIARWWVAHPTYLIVAGVIYLILGVYLLYMGYMR